MVANKLMRGDTVVSVAHHRSENGWGRGSVWEDRSYSPNVSDQQATLTTGNFHSTNNHASKELALWCSRHRAWMGASHGWVPVNTHSTPRCPSSEERL